MKCACVRDEKTPSLALWRRDQRLRTLQRFQTTLDLGRMVLVRFSILRSKAGNEVKSHSCRQTVAHRSNWKDDCFIHRRVAVFLRYTIILQLLISYPHALRNKYFEQLYLQGKVALELVPQGTLVERLRAHAAGIPAFFTPTGGSTAVEEGSIPIKYNPGGMENGVLISGQKKETKVFGGRKFVLEPAIPGDVAFIRAWKVDEVGNTVFR